MCLSGAGRDGAEADRGERGRTIQLRCRTLACERWLRSPIGLFRASPVLGDGSLDLQAIPSNLAPGGGHQPPRGALHRVSLSEDSLYARIDVDHAAASERGERDCRPSA
jgi:hypothetical protein